jgi:glycosyltransferase 2 family protein
MLRKSSEEAQQNNWLWRIISFVIATVIVIFMLSLVSWSKFLGLLAQLSPLSLIAAFLLYVLLNFWRSLRYIALLDRDDILVWRVFPIALYHNFLVRLLPFKLGEVTYIVLMRNRLDVSMKEGVSSLFGSRLLELLVIILVAAISLLLSGEILPNQSGLAFILVVGSLLGGMLGFYYMGAIIRFVIGLLRSQSSISFLGKIAERLESLAEEFDRLRHPHIFAKALFWSIFTYGSSFGVNWILLQAVGVQVDVVTLVILVSLGMFATAFPFNISGFGVVELSWAYGLTLLLGYAGDEAVAIGLMLNGYQLICAAISGLVAYLLLQRH